MQPEPSTETVLKALADQWSAEFKYCTFDCHNHRSVNIYHAISKMMIGYVTLDNHHLTLVPWRWVENNEKVEAFSVDYRDPLSLTKFRDAIFRWFRWHLENSYWLNNE